jgi:hypothetical protein
MRHEDAIQSGCCCGIKGKEGGCGREMFGLRVGASTEGSDFRVPDESGVLIPQQRPDL